MRSRTSPATALRKVAWLGFAVVATLGLGSCRPSGGSGLTIAGSTSVQPIAEMLAERYSASHPELVINVQGGGSSAGVRAAQSGAAQIGMASRELKPDEEGLQTHVMVLDAIVLIVHPSNRVRSLTKAQARGIFAGSIRNWRDLGGDAGRITCITREEGSGTRSAFEEMVMGKTTEIADDCIVQDSTGAARALVAGDRNSIAYVSLGMVTPDVVAVEFDGVQPTHEAVVAGRYSIARRFLLLTKGAPSREAQLYIDYVLTPESQATIAEEGYIPVPRVRRP